MNKGKVIRTVLLGMIILSVIVAPMGVSFSAEKKTESVYEPGSLDNEYYSLEISDEDGRFTLTDKKAGEKIQSYPDGLEEDETLKNSGRIRIKSALFATLFNSEMDAKTTVYSIPDSVNQGGLKVNRYDKEYIVEYHFVMDDVVIPVHYTLDGQRLLISVITDEIRENGASLLMDVSIHPYFYSGSSTEEGYLLVPDGSGSLIHFNNKKYNASPYKQKVYGRDLSLFATSDVEYTQPILMPVFGIGKSNGMMMGVITAGDADAFVEASPGIGIASYNCAYTSFLLIPEDMRAYPGDNRNDVKIYPDKRNDTELLQISYRFQSGESPTYSEMAKLYRDYLIDEYGLVRIEDNSNPMYLDIYMSTMRKKSFLGVVYVGVETLTTYKEAQELVNELQSKGVETTVRLNNWSSQTVKGKQLTKSSMMFSLGSKKELISLKNTVERNGEIYLNGNISEVYGGSLIVKNFTYAKNMRGSTLEFQEFNLATNFNIDNVHYLLSHKNILKNTERFGKSIIELGFDGIGIDGLRNMFTDYGSEVASLSGTTEIYQQVLDKLQQSGMQVAVTGGSQFALGAASLILGLPEGDSMFEICDEAIPFYAIALHGYVPFALKSINTSPDPSKAYLKALETGSGLYYQWIASKPEKVRYSRNDYLYGADASAWIKSAAEHYKQYSDFMDNKSTQLIVAHEKLAKDVYKTIFEDGSFVVVNYSNNDFENEEMSVEAVSYFFGKEED